jgi:hypothetical protein
MPSAQHSRDETTRRKRSIVLSMLRPFARAIVRLGIPIQELIPLLKIALVEAADATLQKTTHKVNASRISLVTGIHRSEIQRLQSLDPDTEEESGTLLGRVIGQWAEDPKYKTKSGEPRLLTYDGEGSEFFQLAYQINTNFNPATVLFELERNKTVERTPRGLRLLRGHALFSDDHLHAYEILGRDFETLGKVVDENLFAGMKLGHFHLRTEYDNIYRRHIPEIREWLVNEGKAHHKRVRDFLSSYDKDVNPGPTGDDEAGTKIVVGGFSLIEEPKNKAEPSG